MQDMRIIIIIIFVLSAEIGFAQKKYTVLASGIDTSSINESYTVTQSRLDSLPLINMLEKPTSITIERLIKIAYNHIKEKYPSDTFVFSSLNIERFAEEDYKDYYPKGYAKDWVAIIFFQYNQDKACQAVPVLFDGTVVRGSNE